jgi:N-acetylmuramoyl-L-alanine amidase
VKYDLCFPIHQKEGKILISAMDVTKIIEPVLRPSLIKNAAPIRTVILDAGQSEHYGEVKGNWGLEEKEATLDVVLRTKRLLEQNGYTVHLTRSRDEFIPLEDRADFANKFTNAVFISVHFSKRTSSGASGIENFTPPSLYSLLLPKASGAFSGIQTFALAPRGVPSMDEANFSYSDLKQHPGHARDPENIALATALHSSMLRHMRLYDRGIKRARFVVLRDITIPGALLEGGAMNHPVDGRLIASSQYRDAFARAILEGVSRYRSALSGRRDYQEPSAVANATDKTFLDPNAN